MAQSFQFLSRIQLAAQASDVIIPANSQIIDCIFDIIKQLLMLELLILVLVLLVAQTYILINAHTIGTTAGRQYPTTTAGGAGAWENIGTSDQRITFYLTQQMQVKLELLITYQQNNNLA